ncbi:MAG: Smr/MutS family protein [Deltaproteobacteria bacterium]|nr:Smr/MutS family protein [Deltaproteobacteria bacterium]
MAKDKPFNNPFGALKLQKPEKPAPKPPPTAPPANRPAKRTNADDDSALFLESVGAVEPVRVGSNKSEARPPPPPARGTDADAEALLQLSELVAGVGPFDLADSDEFIEGAVPGLDPNIVRKLHRGDFAVQAHLDLHGLTQDEAKSQLAAFLTASRSRGFRCVLVVHGRGLHSKDQIPVLKAGIQRWLTQGRMAKETLAFATARPHDGGAGAVYVLLRR